MQHSWITRGTSDRLRVVALGWAADPTMVEPLDGFDTLCIYDYRDIEPLRIEQYAEVHLVAWSYGVWAAEQVFREQEFTTAVAINGTPYPLSEEYGIPPKIFAMTVAKINIKKFIQRMCSGMPETIVLKRDQAECIAELQALADHFKREYTPTIKWTKAVIGLKDLIYPPAAQQRYWHEIACELRDEPHYIKIGSL